MKTIKNRRNLPFLNRYSSLLQKGKLFNIVLALNKGEC